MRRCAVWLVAMGVSGWFEDALEASGLVRTKVRRSSNTA